MREKRPRPKVKEQVRIPANLLEFLREVHELIEAQDEAATVESDDLLQCECAYGGLVQVGTDSYGFTYFPGDGVRDKWEVELRAIEIRYIADGATTELELWACSDSTCQSKFSDPADTCSICDWVEQEG